MRAYLVNLWDAIRASYWFIPGLFATAALVIAVVLPWVDAAVARSSTAQLPDWILTTTTTARATLSALAGAMVAVTGTVFSITVVTLSLTSQQFGPRLLRRFMHDLPTQITLGALLATGLYCLLLLRVVEKHDNALSAPHLSVLVAIGLAIVSKISLIVFIHHIAVLIQAPHIVAAVARDLDDAIDRLFPESIGQPSREEDQRLVHARAQQADMSDDYSTIRSLCEGYVQAIDGDGLLQLAAERDFIARLHARPGKFVAKDEALADIWSLSVDLEESPLEELTALINEKIIVGNRRTPRQDVECAVEELVEVAVRSLSTGINDPFTAINCVDRLGAALGRLAQRKIPDAARFDAQGQMRITVHPIAFVEVIDAAFNQIRQYGKESVGVTLRALEALAVVADKVWRQEDRDAVYRHAQMIARNGDHFRERHDVDAVTRRLERVQENLNRERLDSAQQPGVASGKQGSTFPALS
ncbi:MAG: DUF2254 domain-containing protein [Planctomycetota bacterium]|nr:MAG: DUF2254 domain-containing protein [Planctomycetota bacterium]REK47464.1 MAG: DUF2254 domain-containing protein [Planctomycetota bacterium]